MKKPGKVLCVSCYRGHEDSVAKKVVVDQRATGDGFAFLFLLPPFFFWLKAARMLSLLMGV